MQLYNKFWVEPRTERRLYTAASFEKTCWNFPKRSASVEFTEDNIALETLVADKNIEPKRPRSNDRSSNSLSTCCTVKQVFVQLFANISMFSQLVVRFFRKVFEVFGNVEEQFRPIRIRSNPLRCMNVANYIFEKTYLDFSKHSAFLKCKEDSIAPTLF